MTPVDILASLFPHGPQGHDREAAASRAAPPWPTGSAIQVLGIADAHAVGYRGRDLARRARVIAVAKSAGPEPILFMIDSGSQRMSRHDELLGLNEYLAHLAKALLLAEQAGHRTIGLLYGHTAAGAFIATALAAGTLVALPGADPEVMDLPSVARVTKLPLSVLQDMAKTTPVFAPGIDNMVKTGAVLDVWDDAKPLDAQLAALLARQAGADERDRLGQQRQGTTESGGDRRARAGVRPPGWREDRRSCGGTTWYSVAPEAWRGRAAAAPRPGRYRHPGGLGAARGWPLVVRRPGLRTTRASACPWACRCRHRWASCACADRRAAGSHTARRSAAFAGGRGGQRARRPGAPSIAGLVALVHPARACSAAWRGSI